MAFSQAVVRIRLASPPLESAPDGQKAAFAILDSGREAHRMILFFNPRATRRGNQRYPLSILALAAMIEGREDYAIVDGNLDDDPRASIDRIMRENPARLLAVTVMPGPQVVAAVPVCRWFKDAYPKTPVVWGGYFPPLYPHTSLTAKYVSSASPAP